jgi:membrane protein insertase Oxa1/YidC/SpoIIIJ
MVFTAWLASGVGLFVALNGFITIIPALYLVYILWNINERTLTQIKEIKNV